MTPIRFSVIIPLYNKAPYISKAVESVLGQSFSNFELIVIDNGSTDGSGEIVARFKDARLTIHHQKENLGVSNARNLGVELSTAPYLTFLDADDWWEPTFLENMAGLIGRHPDKGIYGTNYYIVKNKKKREAPIGLDSGFGEGEINYCQVYAKTLCMPLWTGAVCMHRDIFNEMGGFKTYLTLGEDFDLWIRIVLRYKVILLNKPLSNYNQDADASYRSTRQLHPPQHHFLWHIDYPDMTTSLKTLLDRLAAYNLLPYYLSRRYHDATLPLLQHIDWDTLPDALRQPYRRPLWMERIKNKFLTTAVRLRELLTFST